MSTPHIVVIDPAMRISEVECFNRIALTSPLPATYHLPAMYGLQSLTAETMELARAIVILGSASSVNERLPWQVELERWLKPWLERGVPTLGICYGHQMIAHMLGGRVGYLYQDQTKLKGFREIRVQESPLGPASKGEVVVSHCETVIDVPSDMRVLATSDEVAVDGMQHEWLPIMTFQPHPEATLEFLANHAIEGGTQLRLRYGNELVTRFLHYAVSLHRNA